MSPTIRDVAKTANVSIATVSHVINHTRFVSPDLVERVNKAITDTGYKLSTKTLNRFGLFVLILPNLELPFYAAIAESLTRMLEQRNWKLLIYSFGQFDTDASLLIDNIIQINGINGIFLTDIFSEELHSKIASDINLPIVSIGNTHIKTQNDAVTFDHPQSISNAVKYLIRSGHNRIGFLSFPNLADDTQAKLFGYRQALNSVSIDYDENLVCFSSDEYECDKTLIAMLEGENPMTAIICVNSQATLYTLDFMERREIHCPGVLSVIGTSDSVWTAHLNPPLTELKSPVEQMCQHASDMMSTRISRHNIKPRSEKVPALLTLRSSIKAITRGHFGEIAAPPEVLDLTEEDVHYIQGSSFTAALSLSDLDSPYTSSYIKGIRDTFNKLNIKINAILDAHYDGTVQNKQLQGLLFQEPDVVIGQPAEATLTSEGFRKIIESEIKLVLLNNVPRGIKKNEFVTCITGNDRENGFAIGRILGNLFAGRADAKIATVNLGTDTFSPRQRDAAVEQVIKEEFSNIEIVDKQYFKKNVQVYEICKKMIRSNPEIQGLYISWDTPAGEAIRALKELGRTDIAIVTAEINLEIALSIASGGMVKGTGAQRSYEQGAAAAKAAAHALMGNKVHSLIEIQPYTVTHKNIHKAWKELVGTREPQALLDVLID